MMEPAKKTPPLLRQRFLLGLIDDAEPITIEDLPRLCFLQDQNFVHYHFVLIQNEPYSFTLMNDLQWLQKRGFIIIDGVEVKRLDSMRESVFCSLPPVRGGSLYDLVIQSECYKELCSRSADNGEALLTVGYEGRSVEDVMTTLLFHNVRALCDVRANPKSMKFGFSQKRLEKISQSLGVFYIHIPQLGIDGETRKRFLGDSRKDYDALFEEYHESLQSKTMYVNQLVHLLKEYRRIALMCYEKEPRMCHRSVVSQYICETRCTRVIDL